MKRNIDEFLQLDFEEYCRRMAKKDEEDDRLEHEWNLDHAKFSFRFASADVLMDNFDQRLDMIDTSIDDPNACVKHQDVFMHLLDLASEDIFVKELCIRLDIRECQLVSLFTDKLLKAQKKKMPQVLERIRRLVKH